MQPAASRESNPSRFLLNKKEVTNQVAKTKTGSTGRDRTYDQLINSQLHYRCATVEYLVEVIGIEPMAFAL